MIRRVVFIGITYLAGLHASCIAAPANAAATHANESLGSQPRNAYELWKDFLPDSPFYLPGTAVGYLDTEVVGGGHIECSGIIVAKNIVLTARHCIRDENGNPVSIQSMHFWLGDTHNDGGTPVVLDPVPRSTGATEERTDDFALFASMTPFDLSKIQVPRPGADAVPHQHLYIYHHPFGHALTLTRLDCSATIDVHQTLAAQQDAYLRHTCDTQPGSSGAPIFNESFQIVGVHVADGRSPTDATSFNEGLRISRVVQQSTILKTAWSVGASAAHAPEATIVNPTSTFPAANGDLFVRTGDGWFLKPANDKAGDQRIRLKQQGQPDNAYVLWDSVTDTLYQVPLNGGPIRKRQAQDGAWQDVQ